MAYFQCGPLMTCGGFRVGGGVHDSYTFQCGLVGYFTFPGIDTRKKGPTAFTVSSGVNGIAKVPKRNVFTDVGLEPSNVRSPVDSLTHSATASPHCSRNCCCHFSAHTTTYLPFRLQGRRSSRILISVHSITISR